MNAHETLLRDATGRVVLTAEQAELVARILAHDWAPSTDTPEDAIWWAFFDIEKQSGDGCLLPGNKTDALALWVLRWAPVVQAAEQQTNSSDRLPTASPEVQAFLQGAPSGHWYRDTIATEAAVRAARAAGGGAS